MKNNISKGAKTSIFLAIAFMSMFHTNVFAATNEVTTECVYCSFSDDRPMI